MDPLSLTASIITILGVGGEAAKAVKKFARLKGAPDIVLALHNELSDLQLVITAIETAFKTQEMTSTPFPGYRAHEVSVEASIVCSLQQVKEKALELEALHKKLRPALLEPSTPTPRNIRKRIWLVEHKVMKRLQEDLRSARLKLVAALGLLNSSSLNRLETKIRGLHTKVGDLQSGQHRVDTISHQILARQGNMFQDLHDTKGDLQGIQRQIETSLREIVKKTEATSHGHFTQLLIAQQKLEMKLDTIEAATAVKAAQIMPRSMIQPSPSRSTKSSKPVRVSAKIAHCEYFDSCTCICHTRALAKTPHSLDLFLGTLFVNYTGIPFLSPPCNVKTCVQRSSPSTTVLYLFPAWFLTRAVIIAMKLSRHDGPQLNLRVPRRVAGHSAIFIYSSMGDVANVKGILNHRLGSPFDIDSDTGETALMLAIRNMKPEVCKVLLSVGADPYYEHPTKGSAFDYAWKAIVYNDGDATSRDSLRDIFPTDDSLERVGFTLLHKAVVGLNKLDLETLLESLPRSAINERDVNRKTAAWWAARRGDTSALSLLLKHGAEVDAMEDGRAPLLDAAIDSNRSDCIWMLLKLENDNIRTKKARNGWTSLHRSCYVGSDPNIVEWLIEQGTGTEVRARYGLTPLHVASMEGKDTLVGCLLSKGANVNARAITGDTPLHLAIANDKHKVIRLLLHNNVDCSLQTAAGETILHYAAQFGNTDLLKTLCLFNLPGVGHLERVNVTSPTQKTANIKGLTALEIAEHCNDVGPEWLAAFRQLVHDIEFPGSGARMEEQPEEDEEFEDALEHQGC